MAPPKNLCPQGTNFYLTYAARLDRIKSWTQTEDIIPVPVNIWFVHLFFLDFVFEYFSDLVASQTVEQVL